MFYNMLIRSLDRNPQNSGEVFQNAKIRVWGRFQNVWKNIHPWCAFKLWLAENINFSNMPKGGGAILQVSRNQYSFVYTGHIYWYILMKCCMVACINILYWENRSAAASAVGDGGGGRVGGFVFFTRFRPFGVDLQNFFFHWKFWLPELRKISRCMTSSRKFR